MLTVLTALTCAKTLSRKVNFTQINDPAVFDLNGDGKLEILLSGSNGVLGVYDSQSIKPIWEKKISAKAVTGAVVGNFVGTGEFVLGIASFDGEAIFVSPGTGNIISKVQCGGNISLDPSVVTLPGGSKDGLVLIDDGGAIHLVALSDERKAELTWTVPNTVHNVTFGRIIRPASCADVTGDSAEDILVGSVTGGVLIIPVGSPSTPYLWRGYQGMSVSTGISVGEVLAPGTSNLIFGTSTGELVTLTFLGFEGGKANFRDEQRSKLYGPANGHLLVTSLDKDEYLDVIGASENTLSTYDGATRLSLFGKQPFATHTPPLSMPAVVRTADDRIVIFVVDHDRTVFQLDPKLPEGTPPHAPAPGPISGFTPAGNISGQGQCELLFFDPDSRQLTLFDLGQKAAQNSLPLMTYAVNFHRNGQWTTATATAVSEFQKKAADVFAAQFQKAEEALKLGKKKEALALAQTAQAMRPGDPKADKLVSNINRSLHWVRNTLLVLLIIIGATAAAFAGVKITRRKRRLQKAQQLAAEGAYESAISEYRQLAAEDPSDTRIALGLANAYMSSGHLTAEAADALSRARKLLPDNPDVTVALAKSFAERAEETEEAFQTYAVALATMDADRGKIAYHAANVLQKKGETDQAIKYYKLALKEGFAEPDVIDHLASTFIDAKQYTDKALPVFESAAKRHPDDVKLLEGLCRCYSAARRSDESAATAANHLLQIRPDSLPALRLRAKCEIHSGNASKAAETAERARRINPNDSELVAILTHAYTALQRRDKEALNVYQEAHRIWPAENSVLRSLAQALAENQLNDDESYGVLKRAFEQRVADEDVLVGLSSAAEERGDQDTLIRALVALSSLGNAPAEVHERLAEAYALSGDLSPEAEVAYREGLKTRPDQLSWLVHLATIYVRQNRGDAEALRVVEQSFAKDNSNLEHGKHLVRGFMAAQDYENAMKYVRFLLQHHKEDAELQKMFAQASLNSNRIDEAIRQYEQIRSTNPEDQDATLNLARAYAQKQRTDQEAATLYESALTVHPQETAIRVAFAKHHALAGRVARGLEEYRQVIANDPKAEQGVREDIRVLIAQFPERTDLRWFLINMLIDHNELREASEQLDSVFELDPSEARGVLQGYDKILVKDPNSQVANLRKGSLLSEQGHFEQARPLLEKAYAMNAANTEAAASLERLYENLLQETDSVEVRFALAKLNYTQGDFDKAIGHFQKTAQDFRYENESIKMLGLCFVGKGMLEFALQEFKKLVVDDEMKEILYDLAQRYEAKNDLVGAKQVYRQLFAADINYRDVKMKFEVLAGSTSDPMTLEKTSLMTQLSEKARRRYELLEELGRGAMGIVYKAKDNELDEIVALKILPDNLSQNPEAVQRFKAEARSARRLSHPNIVRIHDIGEEMGRKYISMEFVSGTDLKRYLRAHGHLPADDIAIIMWQIAAALDYAHSMQIVHRDIKPANILISDPSSIKVSDFGIAKMLELTSETVAGAIIGTPLYMSPEQVQGHAVDNRADIYSMGILVYELANGKPPFTEGDLAYQHIKVPPRPLAQIREGLNDIIMKCLVKNKDERWATAGEVCRALEHEGLKK